MGEYVGMNRRIGLIGPDISGIVGECTLNSLIRDCSSCRRIVRLSGVRLISNVPVIRDVMRGDTRSQSEIYQNKGILMTIIRSINFIESSCNLT